MRLGHVAAQRERQREGVLGGGDGVRLGRVGDDDPARRRRGHVDVVDPGAGAADHLQPLGEGDQLRGHLGRRADQDRVELADPALELCLVPVEPELDVELGAQQVDAGVGDLLLDQHPRHEVGEGPLARSRSHLGHVLDDPVDARRERLEVARSRSPGTSRSAAGCARACGRARCRRSRSPAGSRRSPRRRRPRRSRSCRRRSTASPGRRRTASRTRTPRPSRRGGPSSRGSGPRTTRARRRRASTRSGRRAAAGSRRPACCRSGPCASCPARVASERNAGCQRPAGPVELGDPRDRGRAQQRQPQPALGAEALLRGEVVGVRPGSGRAAGRPPPEVPSTSTSASPAPSGRSHRDHDPGGGLVVRPGDDVRGRVGARLGRVAGLGLDHDRIGQERRRGGRLRELARELAVAEVQRALAHEPRRGRVPERRGAAVAERHLVTVGQRRRAPRARRGPAPTRSLTGRWRCEVPITSVASASAASASGRTFEGPQPKRPSAGRSSSGRFAGEALVIGNRSR